jgi:hypothetical protein
MRIVVRPDAMAADALLPTRPLRTPRLYLLICPTPMPSILAIVSKAVFETMVPKTVKRGDRVDTDRYHSKNAALEALGSGGSLFLVTVRPPDERLWLVAIVENPKPTDDGWHGTKNATPIADITEAIPKLKFTTGKGLAAKKGALGMSLQTPRTLTSEDEKLLRSLAAGAAAPTPPASDGRPTKGSVGGGLRLGNHRECVTPDAFTAADKKQLDRFRYLIFDTRPDEFMGAEVYDVIDEMAARPAYQLWMWYDNGVLFHAGTSDIVADIVEGAYQVVEFDAALPARLRAAIEVANQERVRKLYVSFAGADVLPPAQPTPPASLSGQIAAWREAVKRGKPPEPDKEFWNVIYDALGAPMRSRKDPFVFRPFPVKRLFDLSPDARAALELVVDLDLAQWDFPRLGLPEGSVGKDPGDLARMLGRAPLGPVDALVEFEGKSHPVWALLSDALVEIREVEEVVDALLAGLPSPKLSEIWQTLAEMPNNHSHRLKHCNARTLKEHEQDGPSPASDDSHRRRWFQLMEALNLKLADGEARAAAVAKGSSRQAWFRDRSWERYTMLASVNWDATDAAVALRALHAQAKARNAVLAPEYDPLLNGALEGPLHAKLVPFLCAIMDDLPIERAQAIAGGRLEALERFSPPNAVARAIHTLEHWPQVNGPYVEKLLARIAKKGGADAKALLKASSERDHPQAAMMKKVAASLK